MDVDDELITSLTECTLCTEPMNSPKFLPCFHCFCRKCIEKVCCTQGSNGVVPCPLCRAMCIIPTSGNFRGLPTNVYAEELLRVSGIVKEASKKHRQVKDELETTRNKLKASEDGRQRAAEEIRRQDTELAETKATLKDRSSEMEELRRNLSDVQSRESVLREEQRNSLDERQRAEEEIRRQDAELAETKSALADRWTQMDQLKRKLSDAESSYTAAMVEVKIFQKAKMEAETSLATRNESYQNISQQLQRARQDTSEQATSVQTELGKSQKEIESLKDQLATMKVQLKHVTAVSVFLLAALLAVVFVVIWKSWSVDEPAVPGYFRLPWSPF